MWVTSELVGYYYWIQKEQVYVHHGRLIRECKLIKEEVVFSFDNSMIYKVSVIAPSA